jgi:pSer/pThr/pTyr-binding forkhead associated (FHA) protein
MNDPRLNSMHLPAARREDFRAARADMLHACGAETVLGAKPASGTAQQTAVFRGGQPLPAGATFVLLDGDAVHPLKFGINTVGRMPDNDVVLPDPYVSRRHVAIVVHIRHGCEIHDFASKNGTLVNGKRVQGRAELRSGDRIQLSDRVLVFMTALPPPEHPTELTLAE